MKKLVLAAVAALMLVPAGASAAQSPCDHNPTDLCDVVTVTVEQPTADECPTGGLVLVVSGVRYPVCNGSNGTDGAPGADGAAGTPGADGTAGVPGVAGSAGADAVAVPVDPPTNTLVRTVIAQPRKVARAAKCERRLNRKGKLVVVCKRQTCPRRASKANPRRLVVKCPPHRGKR